jgi:hypothetical protein
MADADRGRRATEELATRHAVERFSLTDRMPAERQ